MNDYSESLLTAFESGNDSLLLMTIAHLLTQRKPVDFTENEVEALGSIRRRTNKETPATALARSIKLPRTPNEKPYITDWNLERKYPCQTKN